MRNNIVVPARPSPLRQSAERLPSSAIYANAQQRPRNFSTNTIICHFDWEEQALWPCSSPHADPLGNSSFYMRLR